MKMNIDFTSYSVSKPTPNQLQTRAYNNNYSLNETMRLNIWNNILHNNEKTLSLNCSQAVHMRSLFCITRVIS